MLIIVKLLLNLKTSSLLSVFGPKSEPKPAFNVTITFILFNFYIYIYPTALAVKVKLNQNISVPTPHPLKSPLKITFIEWESCPVRLV